jgi:hypothetical protein
MSPHLQQHEAIGDERMNHTQAAHSHAWTNIAVFALQRAFAATPRAHHEVLLAHVYDEVVQRVFASPSYPACEHQDDKHTRP